MLRLLLAGALVVGLPAAAAAGPCATGSLASYIGLGSAGCSIGGTTVSGFSSAASFAGGTEIDATAITVTPSAPGGGFGLDFGMAATALANELVGVLIQYSVSGPGFDTATLELTGAGATAPSDPLQTGGVVTALEDVCNSGDPSCPPSSITSLLVLHDAVGPLPLATRSGSFPSFFDVFVDIAIDGGTAGTAFLDGAVSTRFAPAAVPEPMLTLLLGSGMAGLYFRHRARRGSCAD